MGRGPLPGGPQSRLGIEKYFSCESLTRLQMEIGTFLLLLNLKNARKLGKIGEILFVCPRTEKKFSEND